MPLIQYTPVLAGAIAIFLAAYAISIARANPEQRAHYVLAGIFLNSLWIDVGIALNACRVAGIVGLFLMLSSKSDRTSLFNQRLGFPFYTVLAYAAVVAIVGAYNAPEISNAFGGARSQALRPLAAWVTQLLNVPLAWMVFTGLKTRESIGRFFNFWGICIAATILLAIVQEASFMAGRPLWGVLRTGRLDSILPAVNVGGIPLLRVNALCGEPKHFGMNMVISIGMLAILKSEHQGLWTYNRRTILIVASLGGILISFSSGAFLALAVLLASSWASVTPMLRKVAVATTLAAIAATIVSPGAAENLYQKRIARIGDKLQSGITVSRGTSAAIEESDDKEAAAMAYTIRNPWSTVLGHGFGVSPYYYNHLVHPRWRHVLAEPNSGFSYVILSIGWVGMLLFGRLLWPIASGKALPQGDQQTIRTMLIVILSMWIPLHMFEWGCIFLGLASTDGWYRLEPTQQRYTLTSAPVPHADPAF
ncbi:hypothetical protein RISK_005212 [Rhodopirellula islandica]|uniref:Transmembrane protein n=1 Tax=Rhodopirellula islandica TaxID=595434 RepID=A0A0J1B8Z1_RHOIS|nr:hypothetical protein [Rhodopirellula islandica]KLU02916.1 hypothetical protein RISK_005212 [Rhodopirellula islandica]